ncbi:MAG TPA: MFS transporter [Thermoanaerobaculia bacterium]|nr:MFS transporter [Thermoanaerobaculia bacterium]
MLRAIAASYRDAFAGLSRTVWLLSVATLINRAGTMVMPFLVLWLTEERGFTTAGAGRTLALYGIGGMVASYLGGWLSDRFDARTVMIWSLSFTGLGFLLLGRLEGRIPILATILALSIFGEVFRPASSAALVAASGPAERTRSFALYRLAINLGMTLGPAAGGFLALYDYDWLFVVDGVTCWLAVGLLWYISRKPFAAGEVTPETAPVAPERSPWQDRPFLALLLLLFLMNVVVFQVVSTYPLSLRDLYGFAEDRIGLVLAINTLLVVLFEMVLVNAVAGYDPLKVTGVGAFLFCFGLALLPLGSTFAFAAFTVAIWSVGEMLAFPVVAGVVANRAGQGSLGRYMGLFNLSFATGYVVAPLTGTWVYQHLGARVLWFGCGVVGLLVWAGFHGLAVFERASRSPSPASTPL